MEVSYSKGLLFDYAIIKLPKPVKFTKWVNPICLPANSMMNIENVEARVAGWGLKWEKAEKPKKPTTTKKPELKNKHLVITPGMKIELAVPFTNKS